MTALDEQTSGNGCAMTMSSADQHTSTADPVVNGTAGQPQPAAAPAATAASAPPTDDGADAPDRAQEVVERMAHQVGYFAAFGTRKVVSFLSRAREAVQDFWAEVQDYRHGRKP
jgi:hypothetical protein